MVQLLGRSTTGRNSERHGQGYISQVSHRYCCMFACVPGTYGAVKNVLRIVRVRDAGHFELVCQQ